MLPVESPSEPAARFEVFRPDQALCAHCSAALPPVCHRDEAGRGFCCAGCRTVFGMIHACRLDGYYTERSELGIQAPRARSTGDNYETFDHPDFHARHVRQDGPELASVELMLEGVFCRACVWLIERVPRVVPGLLEARLDFGRSRVRLSFRPAETSLSAIARALDSLGYPAHAATSDAFGRAQLAHDRALLLRLAVAGAAAGNVMLMSLALYSGALDTDAGAYRSLFRWGSLAITLPTVAFSGSVFFRGALGAIKTRTPHMDLPVSIGILVGTLYGSFNTLLDRGEVYFDTITTLVFLLLVGRWLGRRQQQAAARASELYSALAPASARVLASDGPHSVPVTSVRTGDRVEVRAGERLPVDGIVLLGHSGIDASTLTGESRPEAVNIGDRVFAGTLNLDDVLTIRTEAAGAATRVGRLLTGVEQAQAARSPIVRLADRVAGHFVWVVLVLAALTAIGWLFIDPSRALEHAVALLVVTCPCALGMATPLAVSVALSRAAKAGLLFKSGEFVEVLARPALVVLDKTGTLTEGRPALLAFDGPREVQALVRAAEASSEHPIARALQRAFVDQPSRETHEATLVPGGGVIANVEGRRVVVGSLDLVSRETGGRPLPEALRTAVERALRIGATPVAVAVNGAACAVAALSDTLRSDARESLETLARMGYSLAVLSGDHPDIVARNAESLGVPFRHVEGGASPESKRLHIEAYRRGGARVIMVGDGVNDAAALAAADCGFSVHGGAEASLAAADVFATESGLSPLVRAVEGSRRTLRTIRRGIVFSLIYNVIGAGLAVFGVLTPLIAAILMPLSSLGVVTLAVRSRSFERS